MSDTSLNRYVAQGDDAAEAAFTPNPVTGTTPEQAVLFVNDEDPTTPLLKWWDGANFVDVSGGGGSGTVTNTGTLTDHALIVGNGGVDVSALGSLGTTTTVLHGNAAGDPTFGAVALGADVSGDLPFANLTQIAGLSVLGVTGSATADVAAITAGTDGHVLTRVSSSSLAFAAPAASGALVLLEQHAASMSASLDFTTAITSAYDEYAVELINIVPASDAGIQMLVSSDGGSTWANANYKWSNRYSNQNGSTGETHSTGTTAFTVWDTVESTSSPGLSARIRIFNPLSTSYAKQFLNEGISRQDDGNIYCYSGGMYYDSTSAVNAVRFQASTGNLTSGTIRVYGLAK